MARKRMTACGVLALALAATTLGSMSASALDRAALSSHGSWTSFGNSNLMMIADHFGDGSRIAMVGQMGHYALTLTDPAWQTTEGQTYTVKVAIDDALFGTEAIAIDANTLLITGASDDFVAKLVHGKIGSFVVGSWRRDLTLAGAAQAFGDAATGPSSGSRFQ